MVLLGIEPGKNVADIGAGSGWFTMRAARRLASSGTIYAVDINPEAIQYIEQRAKKEQLDNIKPVLSKPDDPQLPADSVDAVLLLKTYHEIAHPIALLSNLRLSLKPGAKIGIIDRSGNEENHGERRWDGLFPDLYRESALVSPASNRDGDALRARRRSTFSSRSFGSKQKFRTAYPSGCRDRNSFAGRIKDSHNPAK
jgi:ubiquinone/menaquinone biosynthesis C-methylase UbiE